MQIVDIDTAWKEFLSQQPPEFPADSDLQHALQAGFYTGYLAAIAYAHSILAQAEILSAKQFKAAMSDDEEPSKLQ